MSTDISGTDIFLCVVVVCITFVFVASYNSDNTGMGEAVGNCGRGCSSGGIRAGSDVHACFLKCVELLNVDFSSMQKECEVD